MTWFEAQKDIIWGRKLRYLRQKVTWRHCNLQWVHKQTFADEHPWRWLKTETFLNVRVHYRLIILWKAKFKGACTKTLILQILYVHVYTGYTSTWYTTLTCVQFLWTCVSWGCTFTGIWRKIWKNQNFRDFRRPPGLLILTAPRVQTDGEEKKRRKSHVQWEVY